MRGEPYEYIAVFVHVSIMYPLTCSLYSTVGSL